MGCGYAGTRKFRIASTLLSAIVLSALGLVLSDAARAGGGPRDVAVVINVNSAVSREIGKYYQAARGIPDANICWVSCPTQEVVSESICEAQIREPIRQFLQRPDVAGRIDYIVLTKGMPLSANYGDSTGPYSLTSVLTCLDHPEIKDPMSFPYGPMAPYAWGFPAPEVAWSHSLDFSGYHFYLVTRLDAFEVDQVKAMIDRGIAPVADGLFVLDRNQLTYGAYNTANVRLGDQQGSAYACLTGRGFDVRFEPGVEFISNLQGVMGYFSWSGHDNQYTYGKYVSNVFVPGSVGDTYYSSSARTFNNPGTTNRSPLIADLIAQGLCGAGGYVSEPYITTATYPSVLFDRYTRGFNMAESFFAASTQCFWKTTIAGDPLMAPYASPPVVSLGNIGPSVSGVATVAASASDASGVSKVAFYIDDDLIGIDSEPPFAVSVDTRDYPIGAHTLEAIAFEASPIATQGSVKRTVVVDNPVSAIDSIGSLLQYADGQMVRLQGKVVTAGSSEMGGCFYMQEPDRTSAIKVVGGEVVTRGQVVTVVGTIATVSGDRVLVDPVVTLTGVAAVPRPLLMKLGDLGGKGAGSYTMPVGRGIGARNVSLLVKVVGRVTSSANGAFYLSDGSASSPVKIVHRPGAIVPVGRMVAVTGLCTPELSATECSATVRVRNAADIQIIQ